MRLAIPPPQRDTVSQRGPPPGGPPRKSGLSSPGPKLRVPRPGPEVYLAGNRLWRESHASGLIRHPSAAASGS